ncbi:MAG: hypothetical protein QOF78_786 [Phycisphaerales bacterium]|jgi:hypothetical protein|nr:hypothetical protein [Phycisphaerales bacterium]
MQPTAASGSFLRSLSFMKTVARCCVAGLPLVPHRGMGILPVMRVLTHVRRSRTKYRRGQRLLMLPLMKTFSRCCVAGLPLGPADSNPADGTAVRRTSHARRGGRGVPGEAVERSRSARRAMRRAAGASKAAARPGLERGRKSGVEEESPRGGGEEAKTWDDGVPWAAHRTTIPFARPRGNNARDCTDAALQPDV